RSLQAVRCRSHHLRIDSQSTCRRCASRTRKRLHAKNSPQESPSGQWKFSKLKTLRKRPAPLIKGVGDGGRPQWGQRQFGNDAGGRGRRNRCRIQISPSCAQKNERQKKAGLLN